MMNVKSWLLAACLTLCVPAQVSSTATLQTCLKNCRVDSPGYSFLRNVEGYMPFVYRDAGGVPTIGFGHVVRPGEKIIEPLMGEDAQKLLEQDVHPREKRVNDLIHVRLYAHQFDAITSFAYNVGTDALAGSTLLKKLNAGNDSAVIQQLRRWNKVNKVPNRGLTLRREAEIRLYSRGFR